MDGMMAGHVEKRRQDFDENFRQGYRFFKK